ncbi:FkbM family methyltransferase [Glycomyces sp. L485]|uniref:FkbM family methyltransferase n=1 Tax=Glycomyces sp. L485 TaxID=2909235 RepID=UPI001F4B6AF8|nr:FkbM family methyltransferase [Glycomyces sp. L485]MCH7230592.1 FkbM family methyltransferase [Glycomyces sp. L485]
MRRSRQVAAWTVDALGGLIGRGRVVRGARFALHRARLDVPNDPVRNGEYALQRWMLESAPGGDPITVLDVGANVGAWSRSLLHLASRAGRLDEVRLHAFEPAAHTHRLLAARLGDRARVNRLAVSDSCGTATLHVVAPGSGTNSLHGDSDEPLETEQVETTTVDDYLDRRSIRRVEMIKVDTEGNDFAVLSGARHALGAQAVSLVQFEYNHRWVGARRYLKDAFDLLEPLGYRIGKLTPRGMESYPGWDPELETFVEGNYLAATAETADRLPRVAWWKRT